MAKMLASDEIRLLILLPAPSNEDVIIPIKCDISIVSLSNLPEYEALSYVWGTETATESIQLVDHTVQVSKTVYNALLRLRLPDRKRTLWIDQLCIDQQDLDEKMKQVRLMRDIYTSCSQCVVWMGEIQPELRVEDADAVVQLFQYMSEVHRTGDQSIDLLPAVRNNVDGMFEAMKYFSIIKNPWWRRIWTVQEAILPPTLTIQWGPFTLPWTALEDAIGPWLDNQVIDIMSSEQQDILGEVMCHTVWLQNSRFGNDDIYNLIQKWRFRVATDPRDMVYGIQGLCEAGRLPLTELCDYTIPPGQVFATITRELIIDGKDLRALTPYPRPDTSSTTPDTPSWAMDLASLKFPVVPDVWYQMHGYPFYRSAEGLGELNLEKIQADSGQGVLRLEGFRIDEIVHVEKGYVQVGKDKDFLNTEPFLRLWYDVAMRGTEISSQAQVCDDTSASLYPGVDYSRKDAFLRLILGGCVRDDQQVPQREVLDDDLEAVWEIMNVEHSDADEDTRLTAYGMMADQNMFVTRNGLLGIGHVDVQAGDEVWVFKGGNVPFTIRPQTTKAESDYRFLGQCYVQGIMMGEVAKGQIPWVDLDDGRTAFLR